MRELALAQHLLLVEAALLVGLALLYLAVTTLYAIRRPRVAKALRHARKALAAIASGEPVTSGDLRALRALPGMEQVELLADLTSSVSGLEARRISDLARAAGLIERALQLCRSRWWWRRLTGCRLLAACGSSESEITAALFRDPSAHVRTEAAVWAGERRSVHDVPELMAMLADPAPACRFASKNALVRMGDLATSQISAAMTAMHPLAFSALEVAAAAPFPAYLRPALALADSNSRRLRALAAVLLGSLGGGEASLYLMKLVADGDATVRAAAARSLGKLVHWQAAPLLAEALRDPMWDVRKEAAAALASMGGVGQLYLFRAVNGADQFAKDMARQVLGLPDKGVPV